MAEGNRLLSGYGVQHSFPGSNPGFSASLLPAERERVTPQIELREVTSDNWREVAAVEPTDAQLAFAGPVTRYLCLCHYGGVWSPLAVCSGGETVGFAMWAIDPNDRSGWIGGLVIDRRRLRLGRAQLLAGQCRRARPLPVAGIRGDRRDGGRRGRRPPPPLRSLNARFRARPLFGYTLSSLRT